MSDVQPDARPLPGVIDLRYFASDLAALLGEEINGMVVEVALPDEVISTLPRIADALERLVDHFCGGEIADTLPTETAANKEVSRGV